MGLWRQGVLGGVQGAESLFLWRAIGGAVLTLVPAIAYSLKVPPHLWPSSALLCTHGCMQCVALLLDCTRCGVQLVCLCVDS